MELYKERNINPFASLGLVVVQLPILIGLYSGIRRVITSHEALVSFSYSPIRNLGWMRQLASNIHLFDGSLFGIVDLTRSALDKTGKTYWPAMIIVIASSVVQFYQSKQLMPDDKQSRSLKTILKESRSGKQSDQTEVNAAVGRSTRYFIPVMIFLFTVNIASALRLYFLVSGLVAYAQQKKVLDQDSVEMETVPKATSKQEVIEGEVINSKTNNNKQSKRTPKNKKRKKR